MNSSEKDYSKLYLLQDKFLSWWKVLNLPFYLTGGTALGRFYLNHRLSEDLDFFTNANPQYLQYIAEVKNKISSHFEINIQQSLFSEDFTRFFIIEDGISLKIEFVNDVAYYAGNPEIYQYGEIDTPINILSNKLSAIVGRDEPKDIFDIIHLSLNYSFNWVDIFEHTKQKALINELDVVKRIAIFPVEWLENVNWIISHPDYELYRKYLQQIADDFLLGKTNSLGKDRMPIESAKPA